MNQNDINQINLSESVFTGSVIGLIGINLGVFFGSLFSLGIALPWLQCWKIRWETEHSYINGKQLHFAGKGLYLWANYLLWGLLSFITLGIYSFWVPIKYRRWLISNTKFVEANINQQSINPAFPPVMPQNVPAPQQPVYTTPQISRQPAPSHAPKHQASPQAPKHQAPPQAPKHQAPVNRPQQAPIPQNSGSKTCPHCGQKIGVQNNYCPYCGNDTRVSH